MEELKRKAELLLEQCESVVLTSIDENGFPRPVPMSKVKTEGITTIWFATGTYSEKTEHFRVNPKAGVCFQKEINSVVLTGYIEIVTDEADKRAFPGRGERPDLLCFEIHGKAGNLLAGLSICEGGGVENLTN